MTENTANIVVVDAEHHQSGSYGPDHYEDVNSLAVSPPGDGVHVWFNGSHYVGVGTASEINEGDLFYASEPEHQLYRAVEIADSDSLDSPEVTLEILYSSAREENDPANPSTDTASVDILTGNYQGSMGNPGAPTLLREQPTLSGI